MGSFYGQAEDDARAVWVGIDILHRGVGYSLGQSQKPSFDKAVLSYHNRLIPQNSPGAPELMNDIEQYDRRWYPETPIAAVGAVVFKDGKILTIKREQEPSKGKWSIPGGRIELGETAHEAARREVREECSIEVEIERVLDSVDNIIRDENGRIKYHFVIIDMLARYVSGEIKAQSDAEECKWVTPQEMAGLDLTPMLREMLGRQGIL